MSGKQGSKKKTTTTTETISGTKGYAVPADDSTDWAVITCSAGTYGGEIATLRGKFANRGGVVWVKITPVINGMSVFLCLDGKSLYVNAIRGQNDVWYYFNDAIGAIPTGSTKAAGGAHYSLLQPKGPKTVNFINKVCSTMVAWTGNTSTDDIRRSIWLLVTFTSEACRFTSVCTAMTTYLQTMTFDLTSVEDTVKSWSSTTGTNTDIVIPYLK